MSYGLRGPRRNAGLVRTACEQVSITFACRLVGVDVPDDQEAERLKLHCPFGELYHLDGGMDRAFRVYPQQQRAHCFAGCGSFTPVSLLAHAWGIGRGQAARLLLERVGYRPATAATLWAQAHQPPPVDVGALAEALKTFCARLDPHWAVRQFQPANAAALVRCLRLLERVDTEEQAQRWLAASKRHMRETIVGRQTV